MFIKPDPGRNQIPDKAEKLPTKSRLRLRLTAEQGDTLLGGIEILRSGRCRRNEGAGEAAARPLLDCMAGLRRGPVDPMDWMEPSAQKNQGRCASFSVFVFGPDAEVGSAHPLEAAGVRQQSGHLAPPR